MEPRGFPVRNRLRLLENRNMLVGLTQLPDKLVFVGLCPDFLSLRTSPLKWCGNPPVRREMYRQLPLQDGETLRFLVEIVTWFHSSGGLPRQCEHWLAMTANI